MGFPDLDDKPRQVRAPVEHAVPMLPGIDDGQWRGIHSSRRPSCGGNVGSSGAVNAKAWNVYLRLEEIVNERASFEQDVLVRWAFREGRRYGRRRS